MGDKAVTPFPCVCGWLLLPYVLYMPTIVKCHQQTSKSIQQANQHFNELKERSWYLLILNVLRVSYGDGAIAFLIECWLVMIVDFQFISILHVFNVTSRVSYK